MTNNNGSGPDLLRRYMTSSGQRAADLCRSAGLDPAALSRWLRGERRPDLEHACGLERHTAGAVPACSWIPKRKRNRNA